MHATAKKRMFWDDTHFSVFVLFCCLFWRHFLFVFHCDVATLVCDRQDVRLTTDSSSSANVLSLKNSHIFSLVSAIQQLFFFFFEDKSFFSLCRVIFRFFKWSNVSQIDVWGEKSVCIIHWMPSNELRQSQMEHERNENLGNWKNVVKIVKKFIVIWTHWRRRSFRMEKYSKKSCCKWYL